MDGLPNNINGTADGNTPNGEARHRDDLRAASQVDHLASDLSGHGFAGGYEARRSRFNQVPSDGGAFDELIDSDGSLRQHWLTFVSMVDDLGPEELKRRLEQARRLVHDNGVTHNIYGDPHGLDRPWFLDFVPLLIPQTTWQTVESGLRQRARLLEAILQDLYGPQRLIKEDLLPPTLLYANPAYLRPCARDLDPDDSYDAGDPTSRFLYLYAADIGRTPDGQYTVIADRTQAPSGAGYTLENRIVLSRTLPGPFVDCHVIRLASFFQQLRNSLVRGVKGDQPRVVLLSPGPYNETYFEHAYLARYLGYTLAEGGDLTVRNDRVYLKTLGGLQPVDVILRRVDDDFSDPVELRGDSFLGVPGLLEASRRGHVIIANGIGAGLAQTPALLAYLPRICRVLLSEDLQMSSVPTWWCGDPASLSEVIARLPELVIKPAFASQHSDPTFCRLLSKEQLNELRGRILARPQDYVAQQHLSLSTAPSASITEPEPRAVLTRCFLAATQDGYAMMPGGLTRTGPSASSAVVSLQHGGASKDTWILSDKPVEHRTLLTESTGPIRLYRGGGELPSRVADNLFWLGRYVERAEAMTRLLRATLFREHDQSGVDANSAIRALHESALDRLSLEQPVHRAGSLIELSLNPSVVGSIAHSISRAHDLARTLRDRVSIDTWRVLQTAFEELEPIDPILTESSEPQIAMLNNLVMHLSAFGGLAIDSMTRGQGWRFLDLGRRIERAQQTTSLVRILLSSERDNEASVLEALLDAADSAITYRRRYLTTLHPAAVCDLILADESNPRSLAYQIACMEQHIVELPQDATHPSRRVDRLLNTRLLTTLRLLNMEAEVAVIDRKRPRLSTLLGDVEVDLRTVSDRIGQAYFAMAMVSRQLTETSFGPNEDGE
jgi:uncharacterized circularly permuted ATP-grasp superfamily protein/uncharacterized alpha-E superfamily protein